MRLTPKRKEKFFKNLLKFTAPGLAAFFGQLALGADWKTAGLTAVLVLYGLASDFFSKVKWKKTLRAFNALTVRPSGKNGSQRERCTSVLMSGDGKTIETLNLSPVTSVIKWILQKSNNDQTLQTRLLVEWIPPKLSLLGLNQVGLATHLCKK
jgi:hypothetical protein